MVEEFITGGFRYQLVRRPVTSDPPPQLTRREREALDYAHQGHSNKSIAFALGLSPSTIGVLLSAGYWGGAMATDLTHGQFPAPVLVILLIFGLATIFRNPELFARLLGKPVAS